MKLGALISRGNPGTDHETLGISHLALLEPVTDYTTVHGFDPAGAHQAIIDAYQRLRRHDGFRLLGSPTMM